MTGDNMSDKAIEALRLLVEVKDHKDKIGKDLYYTLAKDIAWRKAREVLKDFPINQIIEFKDNNGEDVVIDSINIGAAIREFQNKINKLEKVIELAVFGFAQNEIYCENFHKALKEIDKDV